MQFLMLFMFSVWKSEYRQLCFVSGLWYTEAVAKWSYDMLQRPFTRPSFSKFVANILFKIATFER